MSPLQICIFMFTKTSITKMFKGFCVCQNLGTCHHKNIQRVSCLSKLWNFDRFQVKAIPFCKINWELCN
ncbi:hypothetical protein AQUCO_05800174v1 [Aquilegia coerulea]|uniref:Uncharacterized protein n=1 Tax=Aquilegia coerulea TaxID=218851 RepID=A0A2G5CF82_AQUCA|nr:hypothetical protein AQUCO_05800174v1 [Aquilegia coerulea]